LLQIWANEAETDFFAIPAVANPEGESVVYIVDVNGERVVLITHHGSESSSADIAKLESIIGSIHFEQ
jgi:hypothetical protein